MRARNLGVSASAAAVLQALFPHPQGGVSAGEAAAASPSPLSIWEPLWVFLFAFLEKASSRNNIHLYYIKGMM